MTKAKTTEHRLAASEWLSGFDTRIVELGYGCRAITMALSVVTIYQGHSAAPFLNEALSLLDNSTTVWWVFLMATGLFQVGALAIGTKRKTYFVRMIASFAAAFIWLAVLLAMISTPQPAILGSQYALGMVFNFASGVILWTQHDESQAYSADHEGKRSREDAADSN